MSESSADRPQSHGRSAQERRSAAESWERRAADLAGEVQRWLIRSSARTMRDELGDQVRRAFGGRDAGSDQDVWSTATTEPPGAADEPPECAWCPVCRAARRISQAREAAAAGAAGAGTSAAGGGPSGGASGSATPGGAASGGGAIGGVPRLADAAEVMAAAVREALSGLESILSYRPADGGGQPAGHDHSDEGADEPDDRG